MHCGFRRPVLEGMQRRRKFDFPELFAPTTTVMASRAARSCAAPKLVQFCSGTLVSMPQHTPRSPADGLRPPDGTAPAHSSCSPACVRSRASSARVAPLEPPRPRLVRDQAVTVVSRISRRSSEASGTDASRRRPSSTRHSRRSGRVRARRNKAMWPRLARRAERLGLLLRCACRAPRLSAPSAPAACSAAPWHSRGSSTVPLWRWRVRRHGIPSCPSRRPKHVLDAPEAAVEAPQEVAIHLCQTRLHVVVEVLRVAVDEHARRRSFCPRRPRARMQASRTASGRSSAKAAIKCDASRIVAASIASRWATSTSLVRRPSENLVHAYLRPAQDQGIDRRRRVRSTSAAIDAIALLEQGGARCRRL